MASPRKPYTITAPVDANTAYRIDANFDAIFDQVVQLASGVLPVAKGGTGQQSYHKGDLVYADTQVSLAGLHDVATGNVVLSGGVGVKPLYGKVALSGSVTHITGILPATNGGTGFGAYAVGDLLYASTTTALAKLADVATGNAVISGGVSVAPSWGKIGLTTHVSGVLPIANGGTNLSTYTQGDILYASATDVLAKLAKDTNATRYLSNTGASNAPAWAQVSLTQGVSGTLPATSGGTGFASYAVGDLLYADTTTSLAKLADVATGNALISGGVAAAPSWGKVALATHVSGTLPVTSGGTGLASVAQGDLLYSNASNALTALTKNTSSTRYLSNTGSSNNPAWAQVDLSNGVTSTLPVSRGGIGGIGGVAQGDLIFASGVDTFSVLIKSGSATRYLSNTGTSNNPAWAQVDLSNGVTGSLAESAISNDSLLARVGDNETITGTWTFSNDITASAHIDAAQPIRAKGSTSLTTGTGTEIGWTGTFGFAIAFDRTGAAFKPFRLLGSTIDMSIGSTLVAGWNATGDFRPGTDNTYNNGDATFRWKLVRGVTITPGDLRFDNGWSITESDKVGIAEPGLAFLDENDDLIAFVGRNGWRVGRSLDHIDKVKWTKTTHAQRTSETRH